MTMSAAIALLALIATQPVGSVTAEQILADSKRLTGQAGCAIGATDDEIVVCGRRNSDRYRVPNAYEGGEPGDLRGRAGEVPSASPDRLASGRCGIFAGERRCSKAEAKLYGYDGDKNPIGVLIGIGKALLDPE